MGRRHARRRNQQHPRRHLDRDGVPYSDKLTAVERIRRVSPTRLEIETTLTDPEAFVVPFTHQSRIRADAARQPIRGVSL